MNDARIHDHVREKAAKDLGSPFTQEEEPNGVEGEIGNEEVVPIHFPEQLFRFVSLVLRQ